MPRTETSDVAVVPLAMLRTVLAIALAAALGGLLAVSGTARAPGGGSPAPAAFRLADGTAGCAFDGSRLACRTAAMDKAVVLERDGRSHAGDAGFGWDESTPTLRATESWWHGGFSCRVRGGLVCTRGSASIAVAGDGFGGASSTAVALP